MAYAWSLLNKIHQGPVLMLVYQLATFWTAIFLLQTLFNQKKWLIVFTVIAFAPFIQNALGYVVKDSQMALSWLLAFVILFRASVKEDKPQFAEVFVAALLLTYGTWLRPNALPGALPLFVLWSYVVFRNSGRKMKIAGAAVLLIIIVAGQLLLTKMVNPQKKYAENKLFLHDLLGIYVRTGAHVFPDMLYLNAGFDTAYMRNRYHPATLDEIWWNGDNKILITDNSDETMYQLRDAWVKAITEHPDLYLVNRFEGFIYFLRLKNRTDFFSYAHRGIYPIALGLAYEDNLLTRILLDPIDIQKGMPYMKPWFWFFLNILLCFMISRIRNRKIRMAYAVLVISGLLYILPQFLIFQVDTDFRYFYWNCIACTLAVVLFIADRRNLSLR